MPRKLIELASEIVLTQVARKPMSSAEIVSYLRQVFSTLHSLQKAEAAGTDLEFDPTAAEISQEPALEQKPMLAPQDSIQDDKVICLECGAEMKLLTSKHLVLHGMSQKEYKKKYGFTMRTPLAAKSLTQARSNTAKKTGLPENLKKFQEEKKQKKVAASAKTAPAPPVNSGHRRTILRKKKAV
jgi:predicted transcriptional regulator